MFVNFLHPELHKKYDMLKDNGADLDNEIKGLARTDYLGKAWRLYLYTEVDGVTFAIPLRTQKKKLFQFKVDSGKTDKHGNIEWGYLDYSYAVYVPQKYIPDKNDNPLRILDEEYIAAKAEAKTVEEEIRACNLWEHRKQSYCALTNYMNGCKNTFEKRFMAFLSYYCERINKSKESRGIIRAAILLRHFEKDIRTALEWSYYKEHRSLPNQQKILNSMTEEEKRKYKKEYKNLKGGYNPLTPLNPDNAPKRLPNMKPIRI